MMLRQRRVDAKNGSLEKELGFTDEKCVGVKNGDSNDEKSNNDQLDEKDHSLPSPLVIQYLIILRIINAFTINTFFQPDEYYQSLEPAHQLAYGFGNVTWEWSNQLRSFNYPFLFYLSFKLSDAFALGDVGVLLIPKIVQGIISAVSEFYLYKFAQKITGHKHELFARTVLLLSVLSSFNWFFFTRTFSNTFELNLTIFALNFWPWEFLKDKKTKLAFLKLTASFVFAALAVVVRPTNILIWLVLGSHLIFQTPSFQTKIQITLSALFSGVTILSFNTVLDFFYYGKLTFPLWNFLKFNVFSSFSQFYGANAWHFHLTQSVPFILTTYVPFFLYGLWKFQDFPFRKLFITVIAVNITAFSLIAHKEFRFIYQLMPFFLVFVAHGFLKLYRFATNQVCSNSKEKTEKKQCQKLQILCKVSIYAVFAINLGLGVFLTQFQERGVIDVINFLKFNPDVDSIGFLTPCHSTPLQSYLHRTDLVNNIWYLSCEPPSVDALETMSSTSPDSAREFLANYKDESDKFYENPKAYLNIHFPPFKKQFKTRGRRYSYEWPTHLVFFEALEPFMKNYLKNSAYVECDRFFNSYFHWDSRRNGDVVVYCKWPWE